jgi:hypothetical protein
MIGELNTGGKVKVLGLIYQMNVGKGGKQEDRKRHESATYL